MKITFHNLGAINQAEIDLKPLTVFVGENGTGKTWTAYSISTILSKNGFEQYLNYYLNNQESSFQYDSILETKIEELIQDGNTKIDLVEFTEKYAEIYINQVSNFITQNMSLVMKTDREIFENLKISFSLSDVIKKLLGKIYKYSITKKLGKILNILKEENQNNIYFYSLLESEDTILEKIPKTIVKGVVLETIFKSIHICLYDYVYIFPTERTTFITIPFYEKIINKEDSTTKDELSDEDNISTPPFSLKSLLETIIVSSETTMNERNQQIKQESLVSNYIESANLLEKNILQGNINFEKSEMKSELLFEFSKSKKIEMPIASSMIKELAPLVLCLRYLAEPDELLVIDEPEMNLHPSAQVEITELLAMLVNAGLNVLITTHSPYIVDHLSNLVKASKFNETKQKEIEQRLYLENKNAFIDQEKVSIYLFEEGTAKSIVDQEGNIDWTTFSDVSDDIMNMLD